MTGYGEQTHRSTAVQRRANKAEAARLINEENLTTRKVAERLGLAYTTVVKYREELLAEGLIIRKRPKRHD